MKLEYKPSVFLPWLRWLEFTIYIGFALLIHSIVVISALILRIVSYLLAGEPLLKLLNQPKDQIFIDILTLNVRQH